MEGFLVYKFAFGIAVLAIFLSVSNCDHRLDIGVSYMTRFGRSTDDCLATNTAVLVNEQGAPINTSIIKIMRLKKVIVECQHFDIFHRLPAVTIIIPAESGVMCRRNMTCRASLVLRNEKFILNGSECYDILIGHYFHEEKDMRYPISTFFVRDLKPYKLTCSKENIRSLYYIEKNQLGVLDIWSPVEDLINGAIAEVTDQAKVLAQEITDEVNQIEVTVVDESNKLAEIVAANTETVISTVTNTTDELGKQISFLKDELNTGTLRLFSYVHIFLRVLEVLGGLVLLGIVIGFYRKVHRVYCFVTKWLGFRPSKRSNQIELK